MNQDAILSFDTLNQEASRADIRARTATDGVVPPLRKTPFEDRLRFPPKR